MVALTTPTTLDAIVGGLGIWLTGVMFDQSKSYRTAFRMLARLIAFAFVASLFVTRKIP